VLPIELKLAAVLALLLAVLGGAYALQRHEQALGASACQAQVATAAAAASEQARAEEQRRVTAQQEITDETTRQSNVAQTARAGADAAAVGLRARAAVVAARCDRATSDPAAASPSPAAGAPGDLLADVLGRLDAAGRELAATADQRGIAGAACERSHDALKP
jgi:hypothetical protein